MYTQTHIFIMHICGTAAQHRDWMILWQINLCATHNYIKRLQYSAIGCFGSEIDERDSRYGAAKSDGPNNFISIVLCGLHKLDDN